MKRYHVGIIGFGTEVAVLRECGEEKVFAVRPATGMTKMMVPGRPEEYQRSALPPVGSTVIDYYRNVADVIDGTGEPFVKLSETMRVLSLMETVRQAAREHETIRFEK